MKKLIKTRTWEQLWNQLVRQLDAHLLERLWGQLEMQLWGQFVKQLKEPIEITMKKELLKKGINEQLVSQIERELNNNINGIDSLTSVRDRT